MISSVPTSVSYFLLESLQNNIYKTLYQSQKEFNVWAVLNIIQLQVLNQHILHWNVISKQLLMSYKWGKNQHILINAQWTTKPYITNIIFNGIAFLPAPSLLLFYV